jgi:hypothetical protein
MHDGPISISIKINSTMAKIMQLDSRFYTNCASGIWILELFNGEDYCSLDPVSL